LSTEVGTPQLPIRVERYGSKGPAIVMLHGFAAANINWRNWIPALEKHFQLHVVEMKGHGTAPAPSDGRYTPQDHADSVLEYVNSIEADRVVLIGHSMGGGIALLVASALLHERPGRLAAVVSLAGAAYPQSLPPFIALARKQPLMRLLFWIIPKRLLIRIVLREIVVDRAVIDRAQIEAYATPLQDRAHWNAIMETARHIIPPDLDEITRRLPEIDVPVLALWGRQDRVVPLSVGERLRDELPNTRLVVMEDCGHIPTEEKPEESVQAVLGFLRDCGLTG
jgi:pimeloyl-ACP methyl ester carboxylesterase